MELEGWAGVSEYTAGSLLNENKVLGYIVIQLPKKNKVGIFFDFWRDEGVHISFGLETLKLFRARGHSRNVCQGHTRVSLWPLLECLQRAQGGFELRGP